MYVRAHLADDPSAKDIVVAASDVQLCNKEAWTRNKNLKYTIKYKGREKSGSISVVAGEYFYNKV